MPGRLKCSLGEGQASGAALQQAHVKPCLQQGDTAAELRLGDADALTLMAQSHVPDEVWLRVKPHFTPEELVDLSLLVATINAWNRFAIGFRNTSV